MRKYIKAFIETKVFRATIMIIIIFNSIIIRIQTLQTHRSQHRKSYVISIVFVWQSIRSKCC